MEQSFKKILMGQDIEFERLLYPLRYQLYIRYPDANPLVVVVTKEKEVWRPENNDALKDFGEDLVVLIQQTISENESSGPQG